MDAGLFSGKHESKVCYLVECARTRAAYGKYLTYGQLLEPVRPLDPLPVFSEKVFGWNRDRSGTVPAAEARLWRSEDGNLAVFFANYSGERVRFRYRVDSKDPSGQSGTAERTEVLEPACLKVVEIGRP
ncbi:MAG TPA: hypothetical protein VN442_10490 [Bryobacteraceae bacterium]|nr:hypothetical protein [Bryobacteraceae bacterium]